MSVAYGKGKKGLATKLHSSIIRSIGYCEKCFYQCPCIDKWKHGTACKLQAAHIEGRTASGTRTLLINAFCLCASDHKIFTDHPLMFSRWVTETWAQKFRELLIELSRPTPKYDWDARYEELKLYRQRLLQGESLESLRQEEASNL